MGWRFRRSKNIGPVRVTLSKRGLGVSVGVPGARVGIGPDGRQRSTVSVPGTGVSYQTSSKANRPATIAVILGAAVLFVLLAFGACGAVAMLR
jgi:hypothetical protein